MKIKMRVTFFLLIMRLFLCPNWLSECSFNIDLVITLVQIYWMEALKSLLSFLWQLKYCRTQSFGKVLYFPLLFFPHTGRPLLVHLRWHSESFAWQWDKVARTTTTAATHEGRQHVARTKRIALRTARIIDTYQGRSAASCRFLRRLWSATASGRLPVLMRQPLRTLTLTSTRVLPNESHIKLN